MFSILISPPLHIQMAALLSFKSSKKQNKNTRSFAKINSGPNPLLLKDAKIVILAHCRIQKRSKSFFLCSITILTVHSTRFCSAALSWACWLHADYCFWMTLLTMNPAFDYLWFALVAFYAKVPHWAGAPWSNLVPKCQPLGGLSCPVVAQLVTLPTLCLKALTFIRHHRAARGGVTFAFFFSLSSWREAFALVPGVRQQSYNSWNGQKSAEQLQQGWKCKWCVCISLTRRRKTLLIWQVRLHGHLQLINNASTIMEKNTEEFGLQVK